MTRQRTIPYYRQALWSLSPPCSEQILLQQFRVQPLNVSRFASLGGYSPNCRDRYKHSTHRCFRDARGHQAAFLAQCVHAAASWVRRPIITQSARKGRIQSEDSPRVSLQQAAQTLTTTDHWRMVQLTGSMYHLFRHPLGLFQDGLHRQIATEGLQLPDDRKLTSPGCQPGCFVEKLRKATAMEDVGHGL